MLVERWFCQGCTITPDYLGEAQPGTCTCGLPLVGHEIELLLIDGILRRVS